MRCQQSGHDAHGPLVVEAGHDAQHTQLGYAVEAVARFGFGGRRAGTKHPIAVPVRFGQQIVFRGGAGGFHGAQNAASGGGNLLIAGAGNALLEFGSAVARENQVRMRVNKTRRNAAALRIDNEGLDGNASTQLCVRPSCGDAAIFNQKCRVWNQTQLAELQAHARTCGPRKRDELPDIDDC